jgi:hypothetical protein
MRTGSSEGNPKEGGLSLPDTGMSRVDFVADRVAELLQIGKLGVRTGLDTVLDERADQAVPPHCSRKEAEPRRQSDAPCFRGKRSGLLLFTKCLISYLFGP